jgi:hypothetical protein
MFGKGKKLAKKLPGALLVCPHLWGSRKKNFWSAHNCGEENIFFAGLPTIVGRKIFFLQACPHLFCLQRSFKSGEEAHQSLRPRKIMM